MVCWFTFLEINLMSTMRSTKRSDRPTLTSPRGSIMLAVVPSDAYRGDPIGRPASQLPECAPVLTGGCIH